MVIGVLLMPISSVAIYGRQWSSTWLTPLPPGYEKAPQVGAFLRLDTLRMMQSGVPVYGA